MSILYLGNSEILELKKISSGVSELKIGSLTRIWLSLQLKGAWTKL